MYFLSEANGPKLLTEAILTYSSKSFLNFVNSSSTCNLGVTIFELSLKDKENKVFLALLFLDQSLKTPHTMLVRGF